MRSVFADSFYFLALLNEKDGAHASVVAFSRKSDFEVVTTPWVLTEVADAFSAPAARGKFLLLLKDLRREPGCVIVPASHQLFERGVELYARRMDKDWSLTDCISFVVMSERSVAEALTGDQHFEQAGFKALLK